MLNIAYFISPHGFGHAARASAVMQALAIVIPEIHFELFTTVPEWFFSESLTCPYRYHAETVDVGLIQSTPLTEDLDATLNALENLLPASPSTLNRLADQVNTTGCRLVVCDISPLGIQVARMVGIPSLLIENFTWDWIYEGYLAQKPSLARFISLFQSVYASCDYRIQTQPLCAVVPTAQRCVPPISRPARKSPLAIRQELGVGADQKLILLTMGGIQGDFSNIKTHAGAQSALVVIPGGSTTHRREDNLILLPHHSTFYHPDLIAASDAVISKIGYSTIAEAYQAGIPYGYIPRQHFRESPILAQFIHDNMPSIPILQDDLHSARLIDKIEQLLGLAPFHPPMPNGALEVSQIIKSIVT